MIRSLALALLASAPEALLTTPSEPAAEATGGVRSWTVTQGSTLAYRLGATFHDVHGVTHDVEGKARVLSDGTVQVMVRAPVASFDSGNANRDAHMKEVTDAARFPFVVLKAVGSAPALVGAAAPGAPLQIRLRGELTFHGVARPVETPVDLRFAEGGRATATAAFPLSLAAYGVERPMLLFVRVDDQVGIEVTLSLAPEAS